MIIKDYTGNRYGRLVVTGFSHHDSRRKSYWNATCDCGNTKVVAGYNLGTNVNSCGCLNREMSIARSTTHGLGKPSGYVTWCNIRQRCGNPKSQFYYRYGGRGITVCDRWKKFEAFMEDMGEPPSGMTIERINNDLGYSKENCRWASRVEQARNRSTSSFFEHNGETLTLAALAEKIGMRYDVLHSRIHQRKWDITRAINQPVRKKLSSN